MSAPGWLLPSVLMAAAAFLCGGRPTTISKGTWPALRASVMRFVLAVLLVMYTHTLSCHGLSTSTRSVASASLEENISVRSIPYCKDARGTSGAATITDTRRGLSPDGLMPSSDATIVSQSSVYNSPSDWRCWTSSSEILEATPRTPISAARRPSRQTSRFLSLSSHTIQSPKIEPAAENAVVNVMAPSQLASVSMWKVARGVILIVSVCTFAVLAALYWQELSDRTQNSGNHKDEDSNDS
jgi:hypothetical protein